jgi:5'-nucleotidase
MTRRFAAALLALLTAAFLAAAEAARPHILITNDDGIDAPGLAALVDVLKADHRITVAAPASNQSGTSHGITHHSDVLVEERPGTEGVRRFAIHAQPATCVRIALTALIPNDPPTMVLSGINRGANSGRAAWLSGTVAGAREGALAGLPAVAFSAARPREGLPDFTAAASHARAVLQLLHRVGLPEPGQLVKVEFPHPAAGARGVVVTRMSTTPEREDVYIEKAGSAGERLFFNRHEPADRDAPGTDVQAIADGFIAVTALTLDQTDYHALPALMAIPWCVSPAPTVQTR